MFSGALARLRGSLALRLTLWYAGIFAASSILALVVVYAMIVAVVQERTDEDLREDIREFATLLAAGGLEQVVDDIEQDVQGAEATQALFRLWRPDGSLILAGGLAVPEPALTPRIESRLQEDGRPFLETLDLPELDHPVRVIHGRLDPDIIVQVGQSLEDDEEFIAACLQVFLATFVGVILLGGPIGWFMAHRALRGIREVTHAATEIAGGALDRRVSVRSRGDELDRLAQAFNTMLDRIQALIAGMREMTDNLAHDFRSPLARIRASAEMALSGRDAPVDWESVAVNTTEECDRLMQMIDMTLDIAEAESGAARLELTEIDLVAVVQDAADLFRTVAEDRQVQVATDLPGHCRIRGDLHKLQRVVANLLDNALKYTPEGGRVSLQLIDGDDDVKLAVVDTGRGVSPDDLPRIFQRFYRGDASRTGSGNGLGLSLALAFVRAHGGDLAVSSVPDQGSTFTVILPRAGGRRGRDGEPWRTIPGQA